MSDLETRLEQALQADAAPARDAVFRIEIMLRRERSTFRRQVLTGAVLALVAAVLAALIAALLLLSLGGRPTWALAAGLVLVAASLTALRLPPLTPLRIRIEGWRTGTSTRLRRMLAPRLWY